MLGFILNTIGSFQAQANSDTNNMEIITETPTTDVTALGGSGDGSSPFLYLFLVFMLLIALAYPYLARRTKSVNEGSSNFRRNDGNNQPDPDLIN